MKTTKKIILSLFLFSVHIVFSQNALAAGTIINTNTITTPTIWNKAGSPYIVKTTVSLQAKLEIEPGTVIKFSRGTGINLGSNALSIKGTNEEKIIFTSLKDDSIAGDTNNDGSNSQPQNGDWNGLMMNDKYDLEMQNVKISYAVAGLYIGHLSTSSNKIINIKNNLIDHSSAMAINIDGATPVIENNTIINNSLGIFVNTNWWNNAIQVKNNTIASNTEAIRIYYPLNNHIYVNARQNWWGDESGPYYKHNAYGTDNLNGKGNPIVTDGVIFDSWFHKDPTAEEAGCIENCYSNVIFFPGIKSSRLYMKGIYGTEDKVWPPNYFGNDLKDMEMTKLGTSTNSIYTNDVLDEVAVPVIGGNIYKSFLNKLSGMKEDGTINDYESFAYDWRFDVESIAKNGTKYPNGALKSAVDDIVKLAENSKSKKVTIIAHSNGGLLAKAVMKELEDNDLTEKVDKIVFVATPQTGTPLAVLSLLYGYEESALFGTLISREDSRILVENMPGAYGLLPSAEYFKRSEDPIIKFDSKNTRYKNFSDVFGETIENENELSDFLTGKEGRVKPEDNEMEKENVLNEMLINQANEIHKKLDNWSAPANVQVFEIAGWGLDTVSGIKYTEKEEYSCVAIAKIPSCSATGKYEPIYEPEFTVDGDGTVVTPSALMMPEGNNFKRYWVDLYSYNDNTVFNIKHKDIIEINSIINFIVDEIESKSLDNYNYFYNNRPEDHIKSSPRLRMSMYSPLDIHLYDDRGNHTGPATIIINGENKTVFEEGIPNSYYYQFGERKYVGFEEGQHIKVKLEGYGMGAYTLKMEEIIAHEIGEERENFAVFANLPTTQKTKVSFEFPAEGLAKMSELKADVDDDGKNDYEIKKVLNGIAILDTIAPEISIYEPTEGRKYTNDQILKISYSVLDNASEKENIELSFKYDDEELANAEIDLSLQKLGEHYFSIIANDEAENQSKEDVKFFITTDLNAIYKNINHYYDLKLISDLETKDFLLNKVTELEHIQKMIEKLDAKDNQKAKTNHIELFERKVKELKMFLNSKFKNNVSQEVKEILIENLDYLQRQIVL